MAGPIITPTRPPEPDEEDSVSRAPARDRDRSRVALLGVAVSVLAVGGVVWWALQQEPPQFPDSPGEWGALAGAIALYAVATLVRGERWHALLRAEEARPAREDSHGLNVVGYAANNVLPARAGDAVRVFLMAPRAATSKKAVLGTLLAERLLDIAVILTLLAWTVVIWALEAGVWMSTGAAAGFEMDPIEGCYIVALASVFALIPSGPGYAGTQDAAAVTGILALGGTESQALTSLLLVRFVLAVPITIAGLALLAARYGGA